MKKNKVLIVSPHNPFLRSNGGENRIYLTMKEKSKKNQVVLVSPKGKKESVVKTYQIIKDKGAHKTINFKLLKSLNKIIKIEKPDEIQLEFPWQSINLILLNKKYTLVEHNIEFLRFKRTGNKIWPLIYLYERIACLLANKIICVSEIDKKYLIKYFKINPDKICIVENPVDKAKFYPNKKARAKIRKQLGISDKEKMILFFGQLKYRPNAEALEIIERKILPRLKENQKIVICGNGHEKESKGNIIYTGFVEKIEDYINASDLIIVPLLSGSGTRMKILESLACGKKVLSTSIGAEGLKPNKLLKIEDNLNYFGDKIK